MKEIKQKNKIKENCIKYGAYHSKMMRKYNEMKLLIAAESAI